MNKKIVKNIIKATIKGTMMFVVAMLFFLAFINIITALIQQKNMFDVLNDINQFRINISTQEETASVLLSNSVFYPFLAMVLIANWIFCIFIWYPKENVI